MKTLRTLFYLLLAANILLAIMSVLPMLGIQAPWTHSGEADRLTRQLTPEKIQVISAELAPAALAATTTAPVVSSAPEAPNTDPNAVACIALKNLSQEAAQSLSAQAARLGNGLTARLSGISASSYWVNIPPSGGKEGATKRGESLVKAGIEDYIIVRDSGPNQFAISLGLFRNEEAANRLIDQLQKKNIKTARITVRDNTGRNARAEISGRNELLQPLLKDFLEAHKDTQREACTNA